MMKILIIGSKGFIGSHCVSYFEKHNEVHTCDVMVDYVSSNYHLVDSTNADYSDIFQNHTFDVCINCSGAANVQDSIVNPQRDFTLNTLNVFKQLDAIRKYNASCKYINLSSAAVYGNPNYLPVDEIHPCAPISPYGIHKKMAETICESFFQNYNISTCSLRIFSCYGPGLRKQLFWDLHSKSKNESSVALFGSGNESRDFIYIDDVVQAISLVINTSSFTSETINIANGKELKIEEVVTCFFDIHPSKCTFNFEGSTRQGDPINWVASIDKLVAMGYKQAVSLQEGITKYVAWLKEDA